MNLTVRSGTFADVLIWARTVDDWGVQALTEMGGLVLAKIMPFGTIVGLVIYCTTTEIGPVIEHLEATEANYHMLI